MRRPSRPHGTLGGLTFRELTLRVWNKTGGDELLDRAAALSYYFLFSIFPALLFVTTLLSLLSVRHVIRQLMNYAGEVLPSDAVSIVRVTLREGLRNSGHRGLASIGAALSLWIGSAGLASVMTALNVVYAVADNRPWWKRRMIAVLLTAAFSVFLIVSLILMMLGGKAGDALGKVFDLTPAFVVAWHALTLLVAVGLVLTGIALIYYFAPAGKREWRSVMPGTVVATTLWLIASFGLRLYVAYFANYNVIYGSIGGLILLLLWLYLTSVVLLFGAVVNAVIEHAAGRQHSLSCDLAGPRTASATPP
jgi:membrane protein